MREAKNMQWKSSVFQAMKSFVSIQQYIYWSLFSPEEKREAITYDQRWNDPRGKEDLTCSGSCTGLWVSSAALEDKLQAKVETPLYLKKKGG